MMNAPNSKFSRAIALVLMMSDLISASAKCGAVDYSWGADGLAEATTYLGTMMIYTIDVVFAAGGIMAVISGLQIFIKINCNEGDIMKNILMLIGGILFMISSMIVMPAFFGYQDMTFVF